MNNDKLREAAQKVWDTIPATYDESHPTVKAHAAALKSLGAALADSATGDEKRICGNWVSASRVGKWPKCKLKPDHAGKCSATADAPPEPTLEEPNPDAAPPKEGLSKCDNCQVWHRPDEPCPIHEARDVTEVCWYDRDSQTLGFVVDGERCYVKMERFTFLASPPSDAAPVARETHPQKINDQT